MGKYIRKPKGDVEIAVIDVAQVVAGRTRGLMEINNSAAESSGQPKKRKILHDGDFELRHVAENSTTIQCSNSNNPHQSSACRCSGNADLEEEVEEESLETGTATYSDRRSSSEITPLSASEIRELESTAKPETVADLGRRTKAVKMPSAEEIEEFFALAENDMHKKFEDKYNYDFVSDKPLEGRYEWVRLME